MEIHDLVLGVDLLATTQTIYYILNKGTNCHQRESHWLTFDGQIYTNIMGN